MLEDTVNVNASPLRGAYHQPVDEMVNVSSR